MNLNKEKVCNRCGQCCYFETDGIKRKCKYLIKLKNEKTLCRIYRNRFKMKIRLGKGLVVRCKLREERQENFPNCPYNKEEWNK